jgi:hypothetical protein
MRHTRRRESPGPSRRLSGERVSREYGDYIGGDQLRPCRRRQACRTRRRSARPDVVGSRPTEAHKRCARRPPRGRLHRPLRRSLGPQLARGGFQLFSKSARSSLRLSLVSTSAFQLFGFAYCLSLVAGLAVRGGSSSLQTALTKCSVGPLGSRAHQELTPRSLGRSSRMLLCVLSAGPRALGR